MLFNRNISQLLLLVPPLLFSITIHEFSHALAARLLGDNTAADQGRLTLNPVKHLDLMGTLLILMTVFIGWAKPVPVDPRNFKNPPRDMSLVAVAGPLSNLLLVFLMAFIFNFVIQNKFFNHVPESFQLPLVAMVHIAFFLNIGLCFFNLLPIPPLDGFNIISYFLPPSAAVFILKNRFIFFIALIVLIATGLIWKILMPVFFFFQTRLHMLMVIQ